MNRHASVGGSSIAIVLMVLATVSVCVGAALSYTASVSRNAKRSIQQREAIAIGNGALEFAFAVWRQKSRPRPNYQLTTEELAALPVPEASYFPALPDLRITRGKSADHTISNYGVKAISPTWDVLRGGESPPPAYGMNSAQKSYFYLATADVLFPALSGPPVRANVRRILHKEVQSPWSYALFYNDSLEIQARSAFTVTGSVHTNGSIYTGSDAVIFQDKVTFCDEWKIGFMAGDGAHATQLPKPPTYPHGLPPSSEQPQQPFGLEAARIFAPTDGTEATYRGIIERPKPGIVDPLAEARYYNQADVKVLVSDNAEGAPHITILDQTEGVCTAADVGLKRALYDVFVEAVKLDERIRDNRESAEVRLTTLDMSVVNTALQAGGRLANRGLKGIIYIADTSAAPERRRAIRLRNGGIMPPGGLTVASENPVYIQGDYNTGSFGTTQPNSNISNGDPSKNTVQHYRKQPCAIVADAVTILSNNWTDLKSYLDVSLRTARATTINAGLIAGNVPTAGGNYSGGAENFPRFLENWSDTNLTYFGSMIQLFASEQAVGKWGKPNVYSAPRRRWLFDSQFNTSPPPGKLPLISYKQGRWYLD